MADHNDTLRRLAALGVGLGWTCLLTGPGSEELAEALRAAGSGARFIVGDGADVPDRRFDLVVVRGDETDLPPLVLRLWFGGVLLVEVEGAEASTLEKRLVDAGLDVATAEAGSAHGRRPTFVVSY